MDEKKQIEEMDAVIRSAVKSHFVQIPQYSKYGGYDGTKEMLTRQIAVELFNAGYRKQSEGEWVQLPCKVGDTLYVISQTKDKRILPFISTYEATSINVGKRKCIVYHEMDGYIKLFKQDDFGKTVFLTKEEAEQAVTDIRVGSN